MTCVDIGNFDDPKTMDSATKQQLQEVVRKFGDQISEAEKLSKEIQTTEFSTNMAKLFKSKYESNFEPGAITKFEELDKAYEKFNNAFKKLLADEHKHVFDLYKYVYNKAVEAGIKMSDTTKWILFGATGVICVAISQALDGLRIKPTKNTMLELKKRESKMMKFNTATLINHKGITTTSIHTIKITNTSHIQNILELVS